MRGAEAVTHACESCANGIYNFERQCCVRVRMSTWINAYYSICSVQAPAKAGMKARKWLGFVASWVRFETERERESETREYVVRAYIVRQVHNEMDFAFTSI